MTFTDIQTQVAERLNLTSQAALDRIGREIQERYKYVLGAVGMVTASRGPKNASTVIGTQTLAFAGVQKILGIFNSDGISLNELGVDELKNMPPANNTPAQQYAIYTIGPTSVTVLLDSVPGSIYTLTADAMLDLSNLGATDEPPWPEIYHDTLVYGVLAIERDKMEKIDLADKSDKIFESRLSQLRYFIAVSGYRDIHQGKTGVGTFPTQLQ